MTYELHKLRGLWVGVEPSGAYGTALTFPTNYLAFPYMEDTLDWKQMRALLDPKAGKITLDGHSKKVLGKKSASLKFDTVMHSHGTPLTGVTAAPTATTWALFRILKTIFGGSIARGNTGATTVQAGTTATTVNVTAGRGADFLPNGVIACQLVASGPYEAREIASIATDAITVKEAFSAVPLTGSSVGGGVTFYPTENPSDSLQAVVEGVEQDNRIGLYGLQGGVKLTIPIGSDTEMPKLSFDLKGSTTARLSAAAPQSLTYTLFEPLDGVSSELTVPGFGVTTRVLVDDSAFTIEVALGYAPITSGAADQNIRRMRRQATRPLVKGTFTTVNEDNTWYTARDSRTDLALFKQIGTALGSMWLVSVPRIQVTDVQDAASAVEISGQQVSFEGRLDSVDTEIGRAPIRLHCM